MGSLDVTTMIFPDRNLEAMNRYARGSRALEGTGYIALCESLRSAGHGSSFPLIDMQFMTGVGGGHHQSSPVLVIRFPILVAVIGAR